MTFCGHCGKEDPELLTTSFGVTLCNNCWDDYINLKPGRVEYFINIANSEADLEDYSPEEIKLFVEAWKTYKSELAMSEQEIQEIESLAKDIGLLK